MKRTLAPLRDDSGSAMVVSLLFLVAMTIVGTLFVVKTKTETQISGHDTRHAGSLRRRSRLRGSAGPDERSLRHHELRRPRGGELAERPGVGHLRGRRGGDSNADPRRRTRRRTGSTTTGTADR